MRKFLNYPHNSRFLAMIVMAVAMAVMAGWHFQNPTLVQIHPDFVPMQYNTALGFLFTALSVLCLTYGKNIISLIASTLVFILCSATLFEYASEQSFGIDEAFMDHYITTNSPNPGRMSLNTAICFIVISVTIFFAALQSNAIYIKLALPLSAFVTAIGLVSSLGYITGLETSYSWAEGLSAMAVHTSVCFVLLGLSVIYIYAKKHLKVTNWAFCLSSFTIMFCSFFTLSTFIYFTKHEATLISQLEKIDELDPNLIDNLYTLHTSDIFLSTSLIMSLFFGAFVYAAVITFNQSRTLKKQAVHLKNANAELEEFAYRTSHDLRAPLISSIKLLELTERFAKEGAQDKSFKMMDTAKQSLSKLEELVSDILRLTRTKNLEEQQDIVNVPQMVDEIISNLTHMDGFERLTITTNFEIDTLYTLPDRLKLILENLISNAVKYQDTAEIHPMIAIKLIHKGAYVVINVEDNGLGIPSESHDKLFTMFQRFHAKTSYGSGLGLYMIKKSADILNANIRFEALTKGTKFTLTLPLQTITEEQGN